MFGILELDPPYQRGHDKRLASQPTCAASVTALHGSSIQSILC